jgi:hypothetical protein
VNCIAVSLVVSGTLTLLSLIKSSEESGLQLLGTDHQAIIKIRFVSITFSILVLAIGKHFSTLIHPVFTSCTTETRT